MLKKIEQFFIYFVAYAMIGWISEVFLLFFIYQKGFINRGVLFGPYCPVYGFSAVIFIICFHWLMKRPAPPWFRVLRPCLIFFGCMSVATVMELITSYILEFLIGRWPWQTYARFTFNFENRIAFPPAVFFGLGGVALLYFLQPRLEKLTGKLPPKVLHFLALTLFLLMGIDFIHFCFTL